MQIQPVLKPDPAPVLLRTGIAVLIDIIVVFVVVRTVLVAAGHPDEGLTHAVLPAVFGGIFAFLGSLGGSSRSGLARAALLSAVALPLTLIAIVVREWPIASGLTLAAAAVGAGFLAWHGEPFATLGNVLLYMYFLPFVFGAGSGVPLNYLALGFVVMVVCTVVLRGIAALVPHHRAPPRVHATDEPSAPTTGHRFTLVDEPQLTRLKRTTVRSAIGLGIGASIVAATDNHDAVWVLMTLIALIPPALPLTMHRVLQRLGGTAIAMIALTIIDAAIPAGSLRLIALAPGIVITVAFLRRSYTLSVLGVSLVAVLGYSQVHAPLGEALLWRGFDTIVGAVIAIGVTLLIPVESKPPD